jgi:hypothetical protein
VGESRQPLMVVCKAVAGDAVEGAVHRAARLALPDVERQGNTPVTSS